MNNTAADTDTRTLSTIAVAESCHQDEKDAVSPKDTGCDSGSNDNHNRNPDEPKIDHHGNYYSYSNLDDPENMTENKDIAVDPQPNIQKITQGEKAPHPITTTSVEILNEHQQQGQQQRQQQNQFQSQRKQLSSRSFQPPDHEDYHMVSELPRLVQRNLPFHQSRNNIQIENYRNFATATTKSNNINKKKKNYFKKFFPSSRYELFRLLKSDWFHILLRAPLPISFFILITIWTVMIVVFGCSYYAFDQQNVHKACGLGPAGGTISFAGAFAFALETCTTVGYGLPSSVNSFFEDGCSNIQIIIYLQMIWSMMFNAFLFAFFYSQLAKCDSRGAQVIFSNKAIISIARHGKGRPQVRFQLRIYDVDSKSPIVESHVRLYAVLKDRPVPRQLRLIQPDDELNGMVFLSVPTVICHHIDLYSMLHPPQPPIPDEWLEALNKNSSNLTVSASESETTTSNEPILMLPYLTSRNGLPAIRQIDSWTGGHDQVVCPVCGESYGTVERWIQHVQIYQTNEQVSKYPIPGTHRSINNDVTFQYARTYLKPTTDLVAVQRYFQENISEIIVVVEGIEPTISGTFSALQSYCVEDIIFDTKACFRPCLTMTTSVTNETKATPKDDSSTMIVDLDRFHGIDFNVMAPDVEDVVAANSFSTNFHDINTDATYMNQSAEPSWKTNLDTIATLQQNSSLSTSRHRLRSQSYRYHDKIFS